MGTFLRGRHGVDYERGFVQGAGRILVRNRDVEAEPVGIEDFVVLTAGATIYDVVSPWEEVGFTKTGINISRNNAEETFDVDQVTADIRRRPSNWEMSVGTQLAEGSLETFQLAWTLGDIVAVAKTDPQLSERHLGLSAPKAYVEKEVVVLFQFQPETGAPEGLVRAWYFRRCVMAAQESAMTLNKTGEQVSLPVRWNALADSEMPVATQFGLVLEQVPDTTP